MQPSYMPNRSQQQRSATNPARRAGPNHNVGSLSADSESWIEVMSHPSDTSSSDEHIITSGLRISANQRRQRRRSTFRTAPTSSSSPPLSQQRPQTDSAMHSPSDSGASDSEDSGEGEPQDIASFIATLPLSGASSVSADDERSTTSEDDREDVRTVFASSSIPPPSNTLERLRQEDHDAALRASLSTLLSCAAAARGLPPKAPTTFLTPAVTRSTASSGPVEGIRVVRSESGLPPLSKTASSQASSRISSSPSAKKRGENRRVKRLRDISAVQASLYTLAFSAGAIVVLGAITFSAGYWVGKEVGRGELGLLEGGSAGRAVRKVGRVTG